MSGNFVELYTVCEDLVKTLNKKDTTATVLYDLIGRSSNCDYTKQITDSVKPNEALNDYIKANYTVAVTTRLPRATRLFLNTDATQKNTAEVSLGLDTIRVLPFTYKRDLVTSRKMITETKGGINDSSLYYPGDWTLGYDFTFTVFDGIHQPGSAHPAATFTNTRLNLDNKDSNCLQIDFKLAYFPVTSPTQNSGTVARRKILQRVIMHPNDITNQKLMRASGLFRLPNSLNECVQFEVSAKMIGSGFKYGTNDPMIGFFKQNDSSEVNDDVTTDTSNFIDFIENMYETVTPVI